MIGGGGGSGGDWRTVRRDPVTLSPTLDERMSLQRKDRPYRSIFSAKYYKKRKTRVYKIQPRDVVYSCNLVDPVSTEGLVFL